MIARLVTLVGVVGAGVLATACLSESELGNVEATCPSETDFAIVSQVMERRCGTLDCHGDGSRTLRIYSRTGLRIEGEGVSGGKEPTSAKEMKANRDSACGVEPEDTTLVVSGEEKPETLTIIRKPRLEEAHKGGRVWLVDSPGDVCISSWFKGAVDKSACEVELLDP